MTTISLRVNDDESKLIHDYVSVNQLNMSQFIRDAVLDKIENDLDLDEDRILYAFEKAKQEKTYGDPGCLCGSGICRMRRAGGCTLS